LKIKLITEQLRILHLTTAKTWRGGEQQVAYLMEELRKLSVQQWIFCVEGSEMEAYCKSHCFNYISYRKVFSLNPMVAWRIRTLCLQLRITHLHAHDSHSHTFSVLSAALFQNRTPLIVHRRVDFPIGSSILSRWKYNHPVIRRIICVSHFIQRLIAPQIKDTSKLAVVHSGIDLGKFENSPVHAHKLRVEFNVPGREFIIANIAAIAPHKDYFTFVKTGIYLLSQHFPAKFFIIGKDGGHEQAIRFFIKREGVADNFILTGFRTDVAALLPDIDLLLFTSKTEGLGTSMLDAMACGVPVVATAAGGIPEIVEDEVSGLLAPVGDAEKLAFQVRRMLEEPGLKQRLTLGAKARLHHFTKEKMAEDVLKIYLGDK
jgi:glycosyltransferase involved in cell wall biosynthesis